MKKRYFLFLVLGLFIFRLIFGLCSEFWFDDELQIYLIGLKSYATGLWPFYGPDVVYTKTQIPGALQGLLVAIPLYICQIPEAPIVFLNLISFSALAFFAYYISKRFSDIPVWLIWVWVLTTPWALHYSTRVVNPSYVLPFSIFFFISVFDLLPIYEKPILNKKLGFFIMGITIGFIMQLHLSWVLMMPYSLLVFYFLFKEVKFKMLIPFMLYIFGFLIGISTLIPTFLSADPQNAGEVQSNVVFNFGNFGNFFTVLFRYLSFAGYEVSYVLGAHTQARLLVIKENLWMAPFAVLLLIAGFAFIALFVWSFIRNKATDEWLKIKWLTFGTFVMLYISFFFSIKGPSSHTFYLLFPIPILYSFYCYRWIFSKKTYWIKLFKLVVICGLIFHVGLGMYNFKHKSLYKNRALVKESIDKKDYKILGSRRSDTWGSGF